MFVVTVVVFVFSAVKICSDNVRCSTPSTPIFGKRFCLDGKTVFVGEGPKRLTPRKSHGYCCAGMNFQIHKATMAEKISCAGGGAHARLNHQNLRLHSTHTYTKVHVLTSPLILRQYDWDEKYQK